MSRLRLSSVLCAGALLALSFALAACGGGSGKSDESPKTVLGEATLQGIRSGQVELSLAAKAQGPKGGDLDLSLSGPFQGRGKRDLPLLDIDAKAKGRINGDDIDFEGGIVLLPNSAYVNYQGTEYEVDPTTLSFVETVFNPIELENGVERQAPAAACEEEAGRLKVADFLEGAANEGDADVDGTSTTKVSGDLDVPGAIDAVLEVAESNACRNQLAAAGPLPSESEVDKAKREVVNDLEFAHVDVYVGDDGIVRQISAQLAIKPKQGGSGPRSAEIEFDLKLTEVNEDQEISAPENAKSLNGLFRKLGINPLELLGLLEGEGEGLGGLLEGLGASQLR